MHPDIQKKVWQILKCHPGSSVDQIILYGKKDFEPYHPDALRVAMRDWLYEQVKKGLLEDEIHTLMSGTEATVYYIRNILLPAVDPPTAGFIKYRDIPMPACGVPEETPTKCLIRYLPHRNQGRRGTCCGQAASYFMTLNYMLLSEDVESEGEISRDEVDENGVLIDHYPNDLFSAEMPYQDSRKLGNIYVGEGTFMHLICEALIKYGCCLEEHWRTSKSPDAVYKSSYPVHEEAAREFAAQHKIKEYAKCDDVWEEWVEAIKTHGNCLFTADIFEDYDNCLADGRFGSHKGSRIGRHGMLAIDVEDNWIVALNSWAVAPMICYFHKDYLTTSCTEVFVALDDAELVIARAKYRDVEFTSNKLTKIWIDGEYAGTTPVTTRLAINKSYRVTAEHTYSGKLSMVDTKNIMVIDGMGGYHFEFNYGIFEYLKMIFGWLLK